MKIRAEQLRAFPKAVEENLECRIHAHLRGVWPGRCERMGEEAVRGWIRDGMRRARAWGLEADYDVLRYVDLMFLLGRDFEGAAAAPWVRRVLQEPGLDTAEKLDRLLRDARRRLPADRPPPSDADDAEEPPA